MNQSISQPKSKLSRRTLFAGAGAVGAVAVAASLVPDARNGAPAPEAPREPPARGGGYQLTDHVKQYYKTTLI